MDCSLGQRLQTCVCSGLLERTQTPPISNSSTNGLLSLALGAGILRIVPKSLYVLLSFVHSDFWVVACGLTVVM